VEKAVTNILFDAKGILRLSLFSLIESMRTDPQGYCNLIHYNRSSSAGNIDQHNAGQYIHGQQLIYHTTTSLNNTKQHYWRMLKSFLINQQKNGQSKL
jgi:hypothetical protein